jgi:SAM-dependent methyltransferase
MSQEFIKDTYLNKFKLTPPSIPRFNNIIPFLDAYLPVNKMIRILDAGCGNGNYSFYLFNKGYMNITACDLFEELLSKEITYLKAAIDNLPFPDKSFDFILAASVIYYLDEPEKGIKEFSRVLKPGGTLLMTAHTRYSLFSLWRIFKCRTGISSAQHFNYVHFLSASTYIKILNQSNLKLLKRDGYNLSFLIFPVYKYFARVFEILFKIKMPFMEIKLTKNPFLSRIKSEVAYHSVIVARKK